MSKLNVIDRAVIAICETPVPGMRGYAVATDKRVRKARKAYEKALLEGEITKLLRRYAPKEA